MFLIQLAIKNILSKKTMALILVFSIAVSTLLLIGVQKIKMSAKESFSQSISGTDLIVGSRTGKVQLLLYSVFRQGSPTSNMSWDTFENLQQMDEVKWTVPLALGDSHKGFPVLGTNQNYFNHYRYRAKQALAFKKGRPFQAAYEVVLGAEVARRFGYQLDDKVYLSHGIGASSLRTHKDQFFKVVGILEATATPVDKTVHIPLSGLTLLHLSSLQKKAWLASGAAMEDLKPSSITAAMLGLNSKLQIFTVQRRLNQSKQEAMMAIIPGVALAELWQSISTFDQAFLLITLIVTLLSFLSLLLAMWMSLQQRHRELAVLRSLGARPIQLALILMIESFLITLLGILFGLCLLWLTGLMLKGFLEDFFGLMLSFSALSLIEIQFLVLLLVGALLISLIPAFLAYKKSLAEGFISL